MPYSAQPLGHMSDQFKLSPDSLIHNHEETVKRI